MDECVSGAFLEKQLKIVSMKMIDLHFERASGLRKHNRLLQKRLFRLAIVFTTDARGFVRIFGPKFYSRDFPNVVVGVDVLICGLRVTLVLIPIVVVGVDVLAWAGVHSPWATTSHTKALDARV